MYTEKYHVFLVQFTEFSQTKHNFVTSTQNQETEITSTPEALVLPCALCSHLPLPGVTTILTSNSVD